MIGAVFFSLDQCSLTGSAFWPGSSLCYASGKCEWGFEHAQLYRGSVFHVIGFPHAALVRLCNQGGTKDNLKQVGSILVLVSSKEAYARGFNAL